MLNNPNSSGEFYHNSLRIANEFEINATQTNETVTRIGTGKKFDKRVIFSNETLDWGIRFNITASKTKTGSATLNFNYSSTYIHSAKDSIKSIFSYNWYGMGNQIIPTEIIGTDKGVNHSNNIIVFDFDSNGKINNSGKNCTGGCWAMVWNDANKEIGAFNTTKITNSTSVLFIANESMEVFLELGSDHITATTNTMQRRIGIDYPRTVTITVNTTSLENSSSLSAKGVTFNATGGQTPVFYTITANATDYQVRDSAGTLLGSGVQEQGGDVTPPVISSLVASSITTTSVRFTWGTDEAANETNILGECPSFTGTFSNSNSSFNDGPGEPSHIQAIGSLSAGINYCYNTTNCDVSGNCASANVSFVTISAIIPIGNISAIKINAGNKFSIGPGKSISIGGG